MKPIEIQVKINVARREMEYWQSILANKRCGSCVDWARDMCQRYQAKPPDGEKQPGCDDWQYDEIPF